MQNTATAKRPQVLLVIFDGWGIRDDQNNNAIAHAKKPYFDYLWNTYPHAKLCAHGACVGLPDGEMGNSEVGHLTIGAGKIIDTDVVRINKAITDHQLTTNPAFQQLFKHVNENNSTLHFMGLVSPGGVHSHQEQLYAFINAAKEAGVKNIVIHVFTDGRDTLPQSGKEYVEQLENKLTDLGVGTIATISGRYYAMDRDKNWDRVQKAADAIFDAKGQVYQNKKASEIIAEQYTAGKVDEHLEPTVLTDQDGKSHTIQQNDGVFFFNFRSDRARMLSTIIAEKAKTMNLSFVTLTQYDATIPSLVAFPPITIAHTLASEIAKAGLTQSHVAETEKYAHVTYFLNGGIEKAYDNETRILVDSRKDIKTHDQAPEMRAEGIADKVIEEIERGQDVVIMNFANPDMVGHTGNYEATIKAIETVDTQLKRIVEAVLARDGVAFITADHGNAELNVDPSGAKHTAHTTNPVPGIITDHSVSLKEGGLADVAPTILDILDIEQPTEMTGHSLIEK